MDGKRRQTISNLLQNYGQAKFQLPRSLNELVSRQRLEDVIRVLPPGHKDRGAVVALLRDCKPFVHRDGTVDADLVVSTVNYVFGKKGRGGRLFAQGGHSCQKLNKIIRSYITHQVLQDLDFENCFPRFLMQLFEWAGIPCVALKAYVRDRAAIIAEVLRQSEEANLDAKLDRDHIKGAFLKALHLGNYRHATKGNAIVYDAMPGFVSLDQFKDQVRVAADTLSKRPEFKTLFAQCEKEHPKNALGRFVSVLCQRLEHCCLAVCMRALRQRGASCHVNMFDGVMVRGFSEADLGCRPQDAQDHCMAAIVGETGLEVVLTEKVHQPYTLPELAAWAAGAKADEFDTLVKDKTADLVEVTVKFISHYLQLDQEDKDQARDALTVGVDLLADYPDLLLDLYLRGAWSTGKTVFLIKLMKAVDAIVQRKFNRRARILVTSSRKSLTAMYLHDMKMEGLPVVSYSEISGVLDVNVHPMSIWQIESLPRGLTADTPSFDLVICDEWLQNESHVFQDQEQTSIFKPKGLAGLSALRGALSKV